MIILDLIAGTTTGFLVYLGYRRVDWSSYNESFISKSSEQYLNLPRFAEIPTYFASDLTVYEKTAYEA